MGTIYAPPKEIAKPAFDFNNIEASLAVEEKFVADIKAWAKANGKGKLAGEEIRFPVGDGYARYVVVSTRPVKLIHLPVGDAWQFQYAHRLTAADIQEEIRKDKVLAEIFGRKG